MAARETIAIGRAAAERWLDQLFATGVIGLLVYSAFSGGGVSRRQFTALELGILLLVVLNVLRLSIGARRESVLRKPKRLFLPLAGFLGFIIFQLMPLPSAAIRWASPTAYQIYRVSLPGWPERPKWDGATTAAAPTTGAGPAHVSDTWRSLSLSPSISRVGTLKFLMLALLLWVVVSYPVDSEAVEQDALATAMLVSVIALGFVLSIVAIERAESLGILRARGTFVNYDHFAGFLSLILPVAIATMLSDSSLGSKRWSPVLRPLAAVAAFAMLSALMMSGSRAGWIGAGLGSWIALSGSAVLKSASFRQPWLKIVVSVGGSVIVVLLLFLFLGTQGSSRVDDRLNETFAVNSLQPRLGAWSDTVRMIEDFPLTGVGLGTWAEIFPHYESPPWDNYWYWGETHNDFLQLLAETGAIGFTLLGLFLVLLVRELLRSLRAASPSIQPILVGLWAVLPVVIPEELFDFDLQLPANALLFVLLIGVALRLSWREMGVLPGRLLEERRHASLLGAFGAMTVVLVFAVVWQLDNDPLRVPQTPADAQDYIRADPASAQGHISMIELARQSMPTWQYIRELQTVLWLEPTNPYIRDDYAQYLIRSGDRAAGLRELTKSVLFSPDVATHRFLQQPISLSEDEARAIEAGLKSAIGRRYDGAVEALATLYRHADRLQDAALTYDQAAQQEGDPILKSGYLVGAGIAFGDAGDTSAAESHFREAIASSPGELDGYRELINLLLHKKDLPSGLKILNAGIRRGVDPYLINMAFARMAQSTADYAAAESAVRRALEGKPADLEATRMIGRLCIEQDKYAEAVAMFKRAIEIAPSSALNYYLLAQAHEGTYDYFAAEQALRRALALEPDNAFFKARFKQFNDLVLQNLPR